MDNLDKRFFDEVYENTFDKVSHFVVVRCQSMDDVKDIVQETYAEFFAILQKRGMDYIQSPIKFLFRIARFKLFRHYRLAKSLKNKWEKLHNEQWIQDELQPISIDNQVLSRQTVEQVWQFLQQKDVWTQKIFYLFFYADMPIASIANILGLSQSVVKHKLYDTLKKMRSFYQKEVL